MPKSTSLLKASAAVACFLSALLDPSPGAGSAFGQVPPPSVDWSAIDWDDDRNASGTYYQLNTNTGTWEVDPVQDPGGDQDRSESGEEWWFGHTNVKVNGEIVGYATAGYGSWANCYYTVLGCFQYNTPPTFGPTATYEPSDLERPGQTKGTTRAVVAYYNLQGELQWYTFLLPGLAYNVIQDMNGDLVVVGQEYTNVAPDDMGPVSVLYNGDPGQVLSSEPCSTVTHPDPVFAFHGFIAKLNLTGAVIWNHLYGAQDNMAASWNYGSLFEDIVEVPVGGQPTYLAVGRAEGEAVSSPPTDGEYPFMVQAAADGSTLDKRWYTASATEWANTNVPVVDPPASVTGWFSAVAKHPVTNQVFVAGWYRRDQPFSNHCFALAMDPADTFTPIWSHYSGDDDDDIVGPDLHHANLQNYSTGIDVIEDANGGYHVVWPTLANYPNLLNNKIFAGKSVAELLIHGFELNGTLEWSTTLGEVRAYDLQADVTQTSDGKFAVVSTKWATGYSENGTKFGWNELPSNAQQCLTDFFSATPPGELAVDWDCPSPGACNGFDIDPERFFAYWNTDAFVAKLDPVDGGMDWCTQWDADPTGEFECTPGDLRNQECMYKITEAPDGGLVMSGNTSHNFDDYYLTKLHSDCMGRQVALINYGNMPGVYNANDHSYTVATTDLWDQDLNIHGIVRIPDGATLTISNAATIRFADSRKLNYPTRVHVEVGGKLIVQDGALLTSMDQCPGSMWDGIVNQGSKSSQDLGGWAEQGFVEVENATIQNARTAIACSQQFVDGPTIPAFELQFAGGGVVRATDATFRNNVRDVVMGPYENFAPGNFTNIRPNRSRFRRCRFETTASLADNKRYPIDHAYLLGVRGVNFLGNTMINNGPFPAFVNGGLYTADRYAGTGITAINSTILVQGHCDVIVQQGTPCPPANFQRGRFEGLAQAMYVSSFDPSRTFLVDQSDFHLCYSGIRMEGVQDAAITRSTFLVGQPQQGDWENTPYGVYSDQCTGYEIEENSFVAVNSANMAMVGLVIKDSGPYSNRFYNNSFDGFDLDNGTGSIIEGKNADANSNYTIGLEVRCNDYGQQVKNSFDVALTGPDVSVKNQQGEPITNIFDPEQLKLPAGNRFSVDHNGTFHPEEDWFVETNSNAVEYFHHSPNGLDRLLPSWSNSAEVTLTDANGQWPGKALACPSNRSYGSSHQAMRMASQNADNEKQDAESAYDAAKDNGDTYTLLAYVSDASKGSTQVRNALQSVAPKVSEEVWTAAFTRNPALSPLHMTQALLSNSPLQGEVLKLMSNSGISAYYKQLVWNAQDGTANILTLLESAIAYYASEKAQALTDLGRLTWLDEDHLSTSLAELKTWHEGLPAENSATAIAGVLAAEGDELALFNFAEAEELTGTSPELYGVLKRYANRMEDAEWSVPTAADETWLQSTATQRNVIGSAHAQAWLLALGHQEVPEIILLPSMDRRPSSVIHAVEAGTAMGAVSVLAYPNPASEGTVFDIRVPSTAEQVQLRIVDVTGRVVHDQVIGNSERLLELDTSRWPTGLYLTELWLGEEQVATLKLAVQH